MRMLAAIAVAVVVVAGCAVSTPPETFYTLGAAVEPSAVAATATSVATRAGTPTATSTATSPAMPSTTSPAPVAIAIEPARLPELVDRPQMVVSIGESQVVPLEQQRWAEPLRSQIARVIALDVARVLPAARVSTSDDILDGADPARSYRVSLDVQRFETRPGDSASIEVVWTVRKGTGDIVATGRERVRETAAGPGYDGVVQAHNRALATVGRTIAAALRPAP